MAFFQTPPALGNQLTDDPLLQGYLARVLPGDLRARITPELHALGELAGGELYRQQLEERLLEPTFTPWDAWGERIDHIELTPLWKRAQRMAAEEGLIGVAYERKDGAFSRIHQMAKVYLFDPSTSVYTCPLAMTDGAAKTLSVLGEKELAERAIARLASRDPRTAWTSGQWMTERTGGSDVGLSECVAKKDGAGWRLHGTKFFTSAMTCDMALTLGRPEGNGPGGKGLALYYVETREASGRLREGLVVNRLKDKLGTRMLPTAELELEGCVARAVHGTTDGVKNITPMLTITRTWNSLAAVAGMRRAVALVRDYSGKRVAFGATLAEKPLHADTMAWMEGELLGAFMLTFRVVQLLGREEAKSASEDELALLRVLTPLAKLTTGKQAVAVASEAVEAFGGAGYMEDTGLPKLLRDAQVLPIWEGTTNVLSLDVLRALARGVSVDLLAREAERVMRGAPGELAKPAAAATEALAHAKGWLASALASGPEALEAGARRFALTLGRSIEVAYAVEHAAWALAKGDPRPAAAARRLARAGVDAIDEEAELRDARLLMRG